MKTLNGIYKKLSSVLLPFVLCLFGIAVMDIAALPAYAEHGDAGFRPRLRIPYFATLRIKEKATNTEYEYPSDTFGSIVNGNIETVLPFNISNSLRLFASRTLLKPKKNIVDFNLENINKNEFVILTKCTLCTCLCMRQLLNSEWALDGST